MASPSGKAVPVAKVLKFLRTHLEQHPEEGAAIMVAVQSGEFCAKTSTRSELFPDYQKWQKISAEDKINFLVEWLPSTSARMWAKALKVSPEVVHQCFYAMASESVETPMLTRSRSVFAQMLKHKRGHMKLKPVVAFGEDFSIDWGRCGLYELTGAVEKGGERLWSHLVHKPTGTKVPPKILCEVTTTIIESNWDEQAATLTTTEADFSKQRYDMFATTEVHKTGIKALGKIAPFCDLISKFTEAGNPTGASAASSSGASGSRGAGPAIATPKSKSKKGVKRNLSDVSILDDLKAPGPARRR